MRRLFLMLMLLIFSSFVFSEEEQTQTNDSKPIQVDAKQKTFSIVLESNPTTGYSWFIRSYPPDFIVPVKHTMTKSKSQLIGAPSQEIFVFKLKPLAFNAPHQFQIRFAYLRPFERSAKPENKTFTIVTIKRPVVHN